jgi:hypothetical protein
MAKLESSVPCRYISLASTAEIKCGQPGVNLDDPLRAPTPGVISRRRHSYTDANSNRFVAWTLIIVDY